MTHVLTISRCAPVKDATVAVTPIVFETMECWQAEELLRHSQKIEAVGQLTTSERGSPVLQDREEVPCKLHAPANSSRPMSLQA
jgi:hypothetical protein